MTKSERDQGELDVLKVLDKRAMSGSRFPDKLYKKASVSSKIIFKVSTI